MEEQHRVVGGASEIAVHRAGQEAQLLEPRLKGGDPYALVSPLDSQIGAVGLDLTVHQLLHKVVVHFAVHVQAVVALQQLHRALGLGAERAVGSVVQVTQLDQLFLQQLHAVALAALLHGGVSGGRGRGSIEYQRSGSGLGRQGGMLGRAHELLVEQLKVVGVAVQGLVVHQQFLARAVQPGSGLLTLIAVAQFIRFRVPARGGRHPVHGVIRVDYVQIVARRHQLGHMLLEHAGHDLGYTGHGVEAVDLRQPAGAAQIEQIAAVHHEFLHGVVYGQAHVARRVQFDQKGAVFLEQHLVAAEHGLLLVGLEHACAAFQRPLQHGDIYIRLFRGPESQAVGGEPQLLHVALGGKYGRYDQAQCGIIRRDAYDLPVSFLDKIHVSAGLVQHSEPVHVLGQHVVFGALGVQITRSHHHVFQRVARLLIFFAYQVQALAYQAGHSVRPGSLVVHVGVIHAEYVVRSLVHHRRVVVRLVDGSGVQIHAPDAFSSGKARGQRHFGHQQEDYQ